MVYWIWGNKDFMRVVVKVVMVLVVIIYLEEK